MCAVRPQSSLYPRCRFAIAISYKIVGVASCYDVIALEVVIRDHVVVVALEQRHLSEQPCHPSNRQTSIDSKTHCVSFVNCSHKRVVDG